MGDRLISLLKEYSIDHDLAPQATGEILSLLAPELEKARLWDRVKEIAKRNNLDGYPCEGCSVMKSCDSGISLCGQAESIVDALEKEPR